LEGYGLASEIVNSVLNRMGYMPNYIFVSFDQAYELAFQSETNDGVRGTFPFWKLSFIDGNGNARDRDQEMYFSKPLTTKKTNNIIFFNPKQKKTSKLQQAKTISDLSGCKLIVVKGYAYPTEIMKLLEVEQVDSETEAFKKLFGESEPYIVLAEEKVGKQLIKEQFSDRPKIIKTILAEKLQFKEDIYFIASRRNPHNQKFIKEFDDNLEKIRLQGVIKALEAEYSKGPVVRLKASKTALVPVGREKMDDNLEYKLPRGTRAAVIEWGGEFDPNNKEFDKFTLVEIMNGPLKGKKLYIKNEFIELP
jgi:hypothetical protein